jgi:hypothetical protein
MMAVSSTGRSVFNMSSSHSAPSFRGLGDEADDFASAALVGNLTIGHRPGESPDLTLPQLERCRASARDLWNIPRKVLAPVVWNLPKPGEGTAL